MHGERDAGSTNEERAALADTSQLEHDAAHAVPAVLAGLAVGRAEQGAVRVEVARVHVAGAADEKHGDVEPRGKGKDGAESHWREFKQKKVDKKTTGLLL